MFFVTIIMQNSLIGYAYTPEMKHSSCILKSTSGIIDDQL